jgi:hypothetical protein
MKINYKEFTWREWFAVCVLAFIILKVITNGIKSAGEKLTPQSGKKDIEKEIEQSKSNQNYSSAQYNTFADAIQNAVKSHLFTDDAEILNVLSKMKNENDYLHLLHSFGSRRDNLSLTWKPLPAYIASHLSPSNREKANALLKKNNINYVI